MPNTQRCANLQATRGFAPSELLDVTMAAVDQILCPSCHSPNLRRAKFCQQCGHDMVLNNDGTTSGPRYYITRIIKIGGQGAVFETIDDNDEVYAVKELLDRFTDPVERAEAIERFETEAKLLKTLSHPRIPKVYAYFKDEGRLYVAMEFVHGHDLEDVIKKQGSISEQQTLEWADQICDVLDYLHNHKPEPIIFRDMKPSNVMIQPDNSIKLIDFGIAKVFENTNRGTQIGTPGYAPPEQYQGLASIESDIYALAATLHHALTGRDPRDNPPFTFPQAYALKPSVSHHTSDAISHALQMKPEDRFHSVAAFRASLRPATSAPPQVRVAPATQPAVPPQAKPQKPQSRPQPQARPQQQRPQASVSPSQAKPAPPAQQQNIPPTSTVQSTPIQPAKKKSGCARIFGCLTWIVILSVIALGLLFYTNPALLDDVIGELNTTQPSTVPVTYTTQLFSISDVEIVVDKGTDLREAYKQAFLQLARLEYGEGTILSTTSQPSYVGGNPVLIHTEGNREQYRASMQGYIAIPMQP